MSDRYDTFDQDHDGAIRADDFKAMAKRILGACGHSPQSPKGAALLAAAQQYFTALAEVADTDHDGAITKEEFLAAAASKLRGNAEGFASALRPWATAVIDVADVDGDGAVSLEEWAAVLRAMGATPERAAEAAAAADAGVDGKISVDELLAAAVDFYTSDRPHTEFSQI
ncbi:EF-hand domain-containing protein [Nonomuraea sp. NPDC049141]|uniref:EF-hand domain-containing protein n=1 Tax=Nonomuraea sp. NPDC049141 TaxID=3155500 RepID=UPI0033E7976A